MGEVAAQEEKKVVVSPEEEHPHKAFGWAARDTSGHLSPFRFSRRATGEEDVRLKVLYCGICHSELHNVKNEWGGTVYPVVPGHEVVGVVTEVGSKVEKFKIGDRVGVGCLVGSCGDCDSCDRSFENNCAKWVLTYGSLDRHGAITYGGYSDSLVAPDRYVFRFPDSLPLDKGAPLLCAGITVYNPMKHFGLNQPGLHLGVVGLGGLGHVAIRFAKAFGMKVTVISTSPGKEREAIDNFGADAFLLSNNPAQMKAAAGTLDGIIDTVSAVHPLGPLFGLLKNEGTLILVGAPDKPLEIAPFSLIRGGKKLAGSCIGGMKDTQEMLDFAAKHGITADVEVIPIDYVNTAMERLVKNDVRFRFVIDVANTLKATE